jgi:hypothetical protein
MLHEWLGRTNESSWTVSCGLAVAIGDFAVLNGHHVAIGSLDKPATPSGKGDASLCHAGDVLSPNSNV